MKKRIVSFMLTVMLFVVMASGCKKENESNNNSDTETEVKTYQELAGDDSKVTVNWWIMGGMDEFYQYYWSEMAGLKKIQEITGVNINFEVASSYDVYLPMMTARNYPDVITAKNLEKYSGRMAGMYNDGVSVSLNDYMAEWMPNFSEIVEQYPEIGKDLRLDNGEYTFVSTLYDINNDNDRIAISERGLGIRQDWLDEVGLDVPTDMDEWFDVLTAFKKYDPNGNGEQDEKPVVMCSSGWKYFLPAYGIDDDPSIDENGKVVYGFITQNYKEYLTELSKWYKEGLIYNMFEEVSIEAMQKEVTGNTAGAWKASAGDFDSSNDSSFISKLKEIAPNAEFSACPWPKTADGYQWCFSDISSFDRDTTVITDKAVADGVDKAAAYIIDYMLSDEGSTYLCWGIEGESYNVVNGEKQLADGMEEMIDFHGKSIQKWKTYADPVKINFPEFGELSDYIIKNMSEEYYNACKVWSEGDCSYKMMAPCQLSVEQEEAAERFSDQMKNYISKCRARFIQGTMNITDYDSYVKQVKDLGADEYTKIWQEAYDSYMQR